MSTWYLIRREAVDPGSDDAAIDRLGIQEMLEACARVMAAGDASPAEMAILIRSMPHLIDVVTGMFAALNALPQPGHPDYPIRVMEAFVRQSQAKRVFDEICLLWGRDDDGKIST